MQAWDGDIVLLNNCRGQLDYRWEVYEHFCLIVIRPRLFVVTEVGSGEESFVAVDAGSLDARILQPENMTSSNEKSRKGAKCSNSSN